MNQSNKYIKFLLKVFNELPDKAKELCFVYMFGMRSFDEYILEIVDECESPIEKIFFVAFELVKNLRKNEIPEDYIIMSTVPQYLLSYDGHEYYADFMIFFEHKFESSKSINLIIECDGHDFHERTKDQVRRDNERTYILKKNGEDILRFSGSQIYNTPIKCAEDVFNYLITKAKAV